MDGIWDGWNMGRMGYGMDGIGVGWDMGWMGYGIWDGCETKCANHIYAMLHGEKMGSSVITVTLTPCREPRTCMTIT